VNYSSAVAFRQALDQRLKNEAASTGLGVARLRKRVAFELFLRRLLVVAPNRWVLKGALALDFRLAVPTRSTKDIDLGRDDDEQTATRDVTAAQQLALDDFFTFVAVRTNELEDTDEFSAVRFHITAQLAGRTFEQFLLDIGFSDTLSWTPETIHTSELLSFAGIGPLAIPAIPIPQHLADRRKIVRTFEWLVRAVFKVASYLFVSASHARGRKFETRRVHFGERSLRQSNQLGPGP
jgi:Nucleotidyl transferase AbiEii toxin, Type IV TA system